VTPSWLSRGFACVVVFLAAIGVAASFGRGVFLADFATRAEPLRQQVLHALGRRDSPVTERAGDLRLFDSRYAAHPLATVLHILPGGVFLLLAPLQFSTRVRGRFIQFHRWTGRLLVLAATTAASTGLYFGLFLPFAGPAESLPIAVFGGLLLFTLWKAVVAIRGHRVAEHRDWMVRAFALALAISTVRIVGAVLDVALTPWGFGPRPMFVLAIWTGWIVTLGAAEIWVRYTRARSLPA
jgi:uncharacterized membrane protein